MHLAPKLVLPAKERERQRDLQAKVAGSITAAAEAAAMTRRRNDFAMQFVRTSCRRRLHGKSRTDATE